jgi:hypothetical protein
MSDGMVDEGIGCAAGVVGDYRKARRKQYARIAGPGSREGSLGAGL